MPKPAPAALLAYRFFGWRLGPDHADWLIRDLTTKGWLVRQGAPAVAAVLVAGAGVVEVVGGDVNRVLTLVIVVAAVSAFLRNNLRERAMRQQGIDEDGAPLPTAGWYDDAAARLRRNLLSTVFTVTLVLAGLSIVAYRSR